MLRFVGFRNRIPYSVIDRMKWTSPDCTNGRPYWDLAGRVGGTGFPTGDLTTGATNWGFMICLNQIIPWGSVVVTFSKYQQDATNIECLVSDVSTGAYYAGTTPNESGLVLTFTRATHFATTGGTMGSGVSGDAPTGAKYFGFGKASGGSGSYNVTSIVITP